MNHEARQNLAAKIRQLEGLSNEDKAAMLELLNTKQYGLVWENKPENVEERLREELPVLREDKNRAIVNGEDYPNHILIEGDNLEALTTLNYTHEGKVDVIYIDPPYNTGNKDFIYNDLYVDSEDSYRHSKWLSFMHKRLVIAKRLLSDKGVIFISIDENELAQLKMLGDETFAPKNFVGQWNWFKSATPPGLSKKIKRNIEYILCWQKGGNTETFRGVKKTSKSNDPFTKPQNSFKVLTFPPKSITCKLKDGSYSPGIYGTEKFPNELLDELFVENGLNKNEVRFRNRFIWIQSTLDENLNKGLYVELSKQLVLSYKRTEYNPEVPPNFIDSSVGVDTTENAGRALATIFDGNVVFDYPKPVSLIKYILNFSNDANIKILDFFAGSGTAMHATMQLNTEDGGKRQCILVTNNENNICENVTYERNKRVINGYTTPKGEYVEGLSKNNLRYYRTEFIPRDRTMPNMRALVNASTDLLCVKEDIYKELPTLGTIKLKPSLARLFANGKRQMLVIYREEVIQRIVEELEALDFKEKLKVYLFSPGRYAFDDEFFSVQDKVTLCALPAAIYDAYQKVMPKRKVKLLPEFEEKQSDELDFEERGNE